MTHKRLNLEEAARFLTLTPKDLRAMAMAGEIPCQTQGDRLLFEQATLDLWLSRQMVLQRNDTKSFTRQTHADTIVSLSGLLPADCVSASLSGKTRSAILVELVNLAKASGLLYNPSDLLEQLRQREEQGSTAMDNGAALVHPAERDEYLFEAPFICLARAARPVFFGEINGQPTDLFFLIGCEDSDLHVKILGKLCLLFNETSLLADLRMAEDADEMRAALASAEQNLKI